MKLYATITSERATKGQGGNDFLDIKLTSEYQGDQYLIAELKMEYIDKGLARLFIKRGNSWEWIPTEDKDTPIQKAKRQKGEKCQFCTQYPCSQHDGSKYE